MPRAPAARAKPAVKTYSKTPKRTKKAKTPLSSPSPEPPSRSKEAQPKSNDEDPVSDLLPCHTLSKDMVLQIIIAKMEGSRNCDWFELSKKLGWTAVEGERKGKKAKVGVAMSGNELRDTYQNIILPALKAGRALWVDDGDDIGSPVSTAYPATPKTSGSKDDSEDEASHEDQAMATSSKRVVRARGVKADVKGKYKLETEGDEHEEEESDEVHQDAIQDLEDEGIEDESIANEVENGVI